MKKIVNKKTLVMSFVVILCVLVSVPEVKAAIDDIYVAWGLGGTTYVSRLDSSLNDLGGYISLPSAVTNMAVMPNSGNVVLSWGQYLEIRTPDLSGSLGTYDLGTGNSVSALAIQSNDDIVMAWGNNYLHRLGSDLSEKGYISGYTGVTDLVVQSDDDVVAAWGNSYIHHFDSALASQGYISGYSGVTGLAVQSDNDIVAAWGGQYVHRFDSALSDQGYVSGYTGVDNVTVKSDDDVVMYWVIPSYDSFIHNLEPDLSDLNVYVQGYSNVADIVTLSDDTLIAAWGGQYINKFNSGLADQGYISGYTNITALAVQTVPEPTTMLLLGVGSLVFVRKRK